jgi:hypothetical protein
MKWFKHYNTASQDDILGQFFAEQRYDCVALFWVLMEFVSRNETQERSGDATVQTKFLARAMNMKTTRLISLCKFFAQIAPAWKIDANETQISFRIPNWAELQERRGGKRKQKISKNAGDIRSKILDVRDKSKEDNRDIIPLPLVYEQTNCLLTKRKFPELDFDAVYAKYPRKIGKNSGLQKLKRDVKTVEDYELLLRAVENYAREVSGTEQKFIKHFSTWASSWRDWIEVESSELATRRQIRAEWEAMLEAGAE